MSLIRRITLEVARQPNAAGHANSGPDGRKTRHSLKSAVFFTSVEQRSDVDLADALLSFMRDA
jgi:hypothetical protein